MMSMLLLAALAVKLTLKKSDAESAAFLVEFE